MSGFGTLAGVPVMPSRLIPSRTISAPITVSPDGERTPGVWFGRQTVRRFWRPPDSVRKLPRKTVCKASWTVAGKNLCTAHAGVGFVEMPNVSHFYELLSRSQIPGHKTTSVNLPPLSIDLLTHGSYDADIVSVNHKRTRPVRSTGRKRSHRHAPEEARREILDSAARFLRKRHFRDLTVGDVMAGRQITFL